MNYFEASRRKASDTKGAFPFRQVYQSTHARRVALPLTQIAPILSSSTLRLPMGVSSSEHLVTAHPSRYMWWLGPRTNTRFLSLFSRAEEDKGSDQRMHKRGRNTSSKHAAAVLFGLQDLAV